MFFPDSWRASAEIAPGRLWGAFLTVSLVLSIIPLVLGNKVFHSTQRIAYPKLRFTQGGVALTLSSSVFVFSCRPVVAKGWQLTLDRFAMLPTVAEAGSFFSDSVIPVFTNFCGVGLLFFVLYVLLEEF